jgi:hypothetical protein
LALLLTFFVTLGWSLPLFSPQTLHLYNGGGPWASPKALCRTQNNDSSQLGYWWLTPVIPVTRGRDQGGSWFQASPGK